MSQFYERSEKKKMETTLTMLISKPSAKFKLFVEDIGYPSQYCHVQYWRERICFSSNELINSNGESGRTASVVPITNDRGEIARFVSKFNASFSLPQADRKIKIELCKSKVRQKQSTALLSVTISVTNPKAANALKNLFSLVDSSN